jgi:hypothetical protein
MAPLPEPLPRTPPQLSMQPPRLRLPQQRTLPLLAP